MYIYISIYLVLSTVYLYLRISMYIIVYLSLILRWLCSRTCSARVSALGTVPQHLLASPRMVTMVKLVKHGAAGLDKLGQGSKTSSPFLGHLDEWMEAQQRCLRCVRCEDMWRCVPWKLNGERTRCIPKPQALLNYLEKMASRFDDADVQCPRINSFCDIALHLKELAKLPTFSSFFHKRRKHFLLLSKLEDSEQLQVLHLGIGHQISWVSSRLVLASHQFVLQQHGASTSQAIACRFFMLPGAGQWSLPEQTWLFKGIRCIDEPRQCAVRRILAPLLSSKEPRASKHIIIAGQDRQIPSNAFKCQVLAWSMIQACDHLPHSIRFLRKQ